MHSTAALDASVVIWTTTPWTLPGNRAISFSSKIDYGLYEVTDAPTDNWAKVGDKFILADKLAAEVFKQARGRRLIEKVDDVSSRRSWRCSICAHPLHERRRLRFRRAAARRRSRHRRRRHRLRAHRAGPRPRGLRGLDRECARRSKRAASTPRSPTPSTRTAPSPSRRRASPASASSTTRARRATPTRP